MPKPLPDEKHDDYIKRCIPIVIHEGTAKDGAQARVICESMWEQHKKKESELAEKFIPPPIPDDAPEELKKIISETYSNCRANHKKYYPEDTEDENRERCSKIAWATAKKLGWYKDEKGVWHKKETEAKCNYTISLSDATSSDDDWEHLSAVAIIGDKYIKSHNIFIPYSEIKKSLELWNGTLHDYNHMGTSYGLEKRNNIEYVIGYQDNARLDENNKKLVVDVHINKKHPKYQFWKSYIDICKKTGRIPNVSMSISTKLGKAKVSELGLNASDYGFNNDDIVYYAKDIKPIALTTCIQGACSDKDGCGLYNYSFSIDVDYNKIEYEDNKNSDCVDCVEKERIEYLKRRIDTLKKK